MQWVPPHCGVPGNEKADFLATKGAFIMQKISYPMFFHAIKNLIKRSIKACAQEDLYNDVSNKPRKNTILNLHNGTSRRAVTEFCQVTRHDYLQNHLHGLKDIPFPLRTLCSSEKIMESIHLLHCPTLGKMFLAECYWEARDMLD
ncbi:RNase H domain-containing protein [Trichonephila clavipes]|nr:RNase H domain-containing protein [Trichonephila clavipes]